MSFYIVLKRDTATESHAVKLRFVCGIQVLINCYHVFTPKVYSMTLTVMYNSIIASITCPGGFTFFLLLPALSVCAVQCWSWSPGSPTQLRNMSRHVHTTEKQPSLYFHLSQESGNWQENIICKNIRLISHFSEARRQQPALHNSINLV